MSAVASSSRNEEKERKLSVSSEANKGNKIIWIYFLVLPAIIVVVFALFVYSTVSVPPSISSSQATPVLQSLIQVDGVLVALFGAISAAVIHRSTDKSESRYSLIHVFLVLLMTLLFLTAISYALVDMANLSSKTTLTNVEFGEILVLTIAGTILFLFSILLVEYGRYLRNQRSSGG